MKADEQVSTQTETDSSLSEKTGEVVENIVEMITGKDEKKGRGRPKKKTEITKFEFADFKRQELSEKGSMEPSKIGLIINSFMTSVDEGKTEKEYESIWVKSFYRGYK